MKTYRARVFVPIVYEIEAENKDQATQIALECYKNENKQEKITFFAASSAHPEVEVEEIPAV